MFLSQKRKTNVVKQILLTIRMSIFMVCNPKYNRSIPLSTLTANNNIPKGLMSTPSNYYYIFLNMSSPHFDTNKAHAKIKNANSYEKIYISSMLLSKNSTHYDVIDVQLIRS